jgi:hypothetical protein
MATTHLEEQTVHLSLVLVCERDAALQLESLHVDRTQ